jgi:hypothetical protein
LSVKSYLSRAATSSLPMPTLRSSRLPELSRKERAKSRNESVLNIR